MFKKVTTSIVFLFSILAVATNKTSKEEKVTVADLEEKEYALDPSAVAVVLKEEERITYVYNQEDGFKIRTEFFRRIKIYKKEGLSWGTHFVNLEKSRNGRDEESISNIKAYTYSLNEGKVVDEKLKKEGIFREDYSRSWNRVKFTLPNVVEGSIVEYSYIKDSPYSTYIHPIYFQKKIPVKQLNVTIEIPEFFRFNQQTRGEFPIEVKKSSANGKLTFKHKNRTDNLSGSQTRYSTSSIDYVKNVYTVSESNIASYTREPYVDNVYNYISTLEFFLSSIKYPQGLLQQYAYSWDDVLKKNMESSNFKDEISKGNYYSKDLKSILASVVDYDKKVIKIFDFVKQKMRWNNRNTSKPYNGVKEAYVASVGSSGQINGILLSMLRKAGIKARPVFVATSKQRQSIFPNYNAFDYFIVEVIHNNHSKTYLDATDKNSTSNIYSSQVLKGRAMFLSDSKKAIELNLRPSKPSSEKRILTYKINDLGVIKGEVNSRLYEYCAYEFRKNSPFDKNKRVENIKKITAIDEVMNYSRKNFEDLTKPIFEAYEFEDTDMVILAGDEIYIHPMLFFKKPKNPLKLEKRNYPVDWGVPKSKEYVVTITIPEGYKVESVPDNIKLGLPGNMGLFKFLSKVTSNSIQLTIKEELSTAFFTVSKYQYLREFYKQVVEKENEQIVLKRI